MNSRAGLLVRGVVYMQKKLNMLSSPGGRIAVSLLLIILALVALKFAIPRAEEVLIGALAALWPLLSGRDNGPSEPKGGWTKS